MCIEEKESVVISELNDVAPKVFRKTFIDVYFLQVLRCMELGGDYLES